MTSPYRSKLNVLKPYVKSLKVKEKRSCGQNENKYTRRNVNTHKINRWLQGRIHIPCSRRFLLAVRNAEEKEESTYICLVRCCVRFESKHPPKQIIKPKGVHILVKLALAFCLHS